MSGLPFNIEELLVWEEQLPHVDWDVAESHVNTMSDTDRASTLDAITTAWLEVLCETLGGTHTLSESAHFLTLVPQSDRRPDLRASFLERCRTTLLDLLPGVSEFTECERFVVISLDSETEYYSYIARYYPEGTFPTSGGVQIRNGGLNHIVTNCEGGFGWDATLAHEMLHLSLAGRDTPHWLEEGLAQMFEHDMVGGRGGELMLEQVEEHRRYWGRAGLASFWSGQTFHRTGRAQGLSYQLAELIVRRLIDEARPGWFRRNRDARERLLRFFRDANSADHGAGSCRTHLARDLDDLAPGFVRCG